MSHQAAIALGSNLGDRAALIRSAIDSLAARPGIHIVAQGPVIETEPVGPPGQGPYLNSAAVLRTSLEARELLEQLLAVEREHGRTRSAGQRDGPRLLDLDLLLFDQIICDEPGLTLPHPRMHQRRFVLEPLAAIAPDWIHPQIGLTAAALRDRLPPES